MMVVHDFGKDINNLAKSLRFGKCQTKSDGCGGKTVCWKLIPTTGDIG